MTESVPSTREEARLLNRTLTEKVLNRAASDPAWKQLLLDDPEAAMREANFPELQQIEQAEQRALATQPHAEVRGQECVSGTLFDSQPPEQVWWTHWRCYYMTAYEHLVCAPGYPHG